MKAALTLTLMCVVFSLSAQNTTNIQWRNDRTGIYNETNLLTSWPADGPQLLWHADGLGEGHSSVAIDSDKIYVQGMIESMGYLFVFDMNGNLLNRVQYGGEWVDSHRGSRATPTIVDGRIFVHTGLGELICFDQNTLNVLWRRNAITEFGGRNVTHGVTESPLVVGNKVILSAGGTEYNILALNVADGSVIWSSPGMGDPPGYCSPIFIANQEVPQIVTTMGQHILGLELTTGRVLWSHPFPSIRGINPNSPLYDGVNMILVSNGYERGSVMLRLTNGGRSVEKIWENDDLKSKHGGIVRIGDYVYMGGDARAMRFWFAVNWYTGQIAWRDNTLSPGTVIADGNGMLYFYSDRGDMALVRANPERFDLVSRFRVNLGTGQHWAHPVIFNGVLYVRRGNTLMAYRIR